MEPTFSDNDRAEAAVWQAMVLFSTLSTAADVWHQARERRAGRDPSMQEETPFVRSFLREAAGTLQAALMQLQASRIQSERGEEEAIAGLVRRYNELMLLRQIEQLLHVIHQRLLSLYPAISEDLAETARVLHSDSHLLLESESDMFLEDLGFFVHQALVFAGDLHRVLQGY
ncbi:MAG TPA: hypothetical protein VKP65_17425 [Rhodothermales bacterium]|nr:hypothetical protein [Rhodothermales bacterium]